MSVLGNIGIIGGTGWIGSSIVKQVLAKRFMPAENIWVSNRNGLYGPLESSEGIHFTQDNAELIHHCDTIVLSVRPHQLRTLKLNLERHVVISVMAGVTTARIAEITQSERVIRTMPNAAAEIGLSYTPWYATSSVDQLTAKTVQALLTTFGKAEQVSNEDQIDFFTALTGSGHGWVAYFESCLIQCAMHHGVERPLAERAIRELFYGMGTLLSRSKEPVDATIKTLVDYAGTTAAGLVEMQQSGIAKDVETSILAAYKKAKSDMTK